MTDINTPPTGERLLLMLAALDNPHRLRIIAALASGGRNYISQLELSHDGKALNYFEASPFELRLTPASIAAAASSLTPNPD